MAAGISDPIPTPFPVTVSTLPPVPTLISDAVTIPAITFELEEFKLKFVIDNVPLMSTSPSNLAVEIN